MPQIHTAVTTAELDLGSHVAAVRHEGAGAVASFVGIIRDHDPEAEGAVTSIDYSHHPAAESVLARLALGVVERVDPDGVARVAISHRVGHLEVGDIALVCCVATPHRRLAFEICDALVEEVKGGLPVWKHQHEVGGRSVWSGLRPRGRT